MTDALALKRDALEARIISQVTEILSIGLSAPIVYVRVRPTGSLDVTCETSRCCSEDEYYHRVPHTLSLEILEGTRNYSDLSPDEIDECRAYARDAAEEIVVGWHKRITAWVEAGNLQTEEVASE